MFLFYIGAFCALIHDVMTLQSPEDTHEILLNQDKIDKTKEELLQGCFLTILTFIYLAWLVGVLFTNSWPLAVIIFLMGLVGKKNKPNWFLVVDAFISIFLVILIVLNEAHFKIHLF